MSENNRLKLRAGVEQRGQRLNGHLTVLARRVNAVIRRLTNFPPQELSLIRSIRGCYCFRTKCFSSSSIASSISRISSSLVILLRVISLASANVWVRDADRNKLLSATTSVSASCCGVIIILR